MDPYSEAHLFVAAIRLLKHRKHSPPAVEDVCETVGVSVEAGLAVCRRLGKLAIVTIAEDPFSIKVDIGDHLAIEQLPRQEDAGDSLSREVESFMAKKKDMDKKVDRIKAELEKKKQDLHSDFEARFRKEMERMKKG